MLVVFTTKNTLSNMDYLMRHIKLLEIMSSCLEQKHNLKTYWVNELTVIMGNQGISNHQIKKVYLETTKAKIETANSTIFIAKMEYYLWMLKYQAKKLLYAFTK